MGNCHCVHDPVPDARLGPATKPIVAGGVRPIAFRKVRPGSSATQHPENAIQDTPVIHTRHTARLPRKHSINDRPLRIAQIIRSEEHTYELKSLMSTTYDVFCLKQKKKKIKEQN